MEQKMQQSQNILNWYDFGEQDEILEIGGNFGELTQLFCKKAKWVTTIEPNAENAEKIKNKCKEESNFEIIQKNVKNSKLQKKYDKIILIGIPERLEEIFGKNLKLDQIIKTIESNLQDNGKIILAVDNKFGIKQFAGTPDNVLNKRFVTLMGYSNEPEKIETYTKKGLEDIFDKLGYKYFFYYPLPNYKIPDVIFSDKQLPKYNSVDKYNLFVPENAITVINEIDVLREILKSNPEMFTFFANSFLIEISKNDIEAKYKYISYNNMRKKEYRLITKIADNYVEKEATNDSAIAHIENIAKYTKIFKELNINILDYEEDGKIKSKYVEQELLLNNMITKALEKKDIKEFEKIMDNYIKLLNTNTYKEQNYENTVFKEYDIQIDNKEIINDLHFMENGFWDMTFKNCFYIDNDFYFFDQEWNDNKLPAEYILYRSILYTISLRRYINIDELFEKYNLTKYIDLFNKLDNKLQEQIRDDDVWKMYNRNTIINLDLTLQEIRNSHEREANKDKAIAYYEKRINKMFTTKVKRFLKGKYGGKNEQKN